MTAGIAGPRAERGAASGSNVGSPALRRSLGRIGHTLSTSARGLCRMGAKPTASRKGKRCRAWNRKPPGSASLRHAISVLAGLGLFAVIAVAGFLQVTTPGGIDETSPTTAALGFAITGWRRWNSSRDPRNRLAAERTRLERVRRRGTITSLLALLGTGGLIVVGTLAR